MGSLKIAIVVHGKFHAFGLACALAQQGHSVTVLTNCPRRFAGYDLPKNVVVRTFWGHLVRAKWWQRSRGVLRTSEKRLLESFGKWAESQLRDQTWDVIYAWSSVAKELLLSTRVKAAARLVVRGSTHIRFQDRLLQEESERTGLAIERPESSTLERELAEYDLADRIVVLSNFCKQSFIDEGVDPDRLIVMLPGVNTERFRCEDANHQARANRVKSSAPLHVLTVGTFCQRKGAFDYCDVVERLPADRFTFRFVGSVSEDAIALKQSIKHKVNFVQRVAQAHVPQHMAWGDLFFFPTLEEGFPQSVMQAAASGLPVLTTHNGAGDDLLAMGAQGWLIPARDPKQVAALLVQLDQNRNLVLEKLHTVVAPRTWQTAADDLLRSLSGHLAGA